MPINVVRDNEITIDIAPVLVVIQVALPTLNLEGRTHIDAIPVL